MLRLDSLGLLAMIPVIALGCGQGGSPSGVSGTGPMNGQAKSVEVPLKKDGSLIHEPTKVDEQTTTHSGINEPTKAGERTTTYSGIIYETLVEGHGKQAGPNDRVTIHYTGMFEDGKVFDNSRERSNPWTFDLGSNLAPPGLNYGIPGMKVGERRKLTLPPNVGYGAFGTFNKEYAPGVKDVTGSFQTGVRPLIPPNSTVIFDVELIEATNKPEGGG